LFLSEIEILRKINNLHILKNQKKKLYP